MRKKILRVVGPTVLLLAACSPSASTQNSVAPGAVAPIAAVTHAAPEFIHATGGPARPFSPAVRANGLLFLSGQVGTDSTGTLVAGGIQAETKQAMENIRQVLTQNHSSFDHVVKCTVFLADMKEWAAMNDVYVTFFDADKRPARSAMGANGLALNSHVEIECLAAE
jgi:2-iminobutanoate/2-iminopropanoate deaminase